MLKPLTPLMRQYFAIKEIYPDALLFFQVGDFYELFFDDALTAASVLGIALTKRGTHNGEPIPLCGVPIHVKDHYLNKVVKAGFKVALCDQLEAPQPGKVVDRGVTQVLTPGTLTDTKLLDEKSASYLAAFFPGSSSWTLLCAEILTGQLTVILIADCSYERLEAELARFLPDEIVLPDTKEGLVWRTYFQKQGSVVSLQRMEDNSPGREWFFDQFGNQVMGRADSFFGAVELLYSYLMKTNERALRELSQLVQVSPEDYMLLDAATQKNLELVKNSYDGSSKDTLFSALDRTVTPMGSRKLKKWILRPLRTQSACEERLEAVEQLVQDHSFKTALRCELKKVGDLERIVGRIALKRAHLHDYHALFAAVEAVPESKQLLMSKRSLLHSLAERLHTHDELRTFLKDALPEGSTDWLIRSGYDKELDRLRELTAHGAQVIASLEDLEQKKTRISTLKINYNQVQGYAFEVTKAQIPHVPAHFIRLQTLTNKERYTTPELRALEYDLQRARTEALQREKELFESIKKTVEGYLPSLKKVAASLATLDVLASFAETAYCFNYVRPSFNEQQELHITSGRHPVVEQRIQESFIPNDVRLTHDSSLWLITGPNMGGKSTFLRQVALITLLAQIGSFVPALKAHLTCVDRIFTRIGASDNLAEGKSTFLVEMEETARICSYATPKSLVILDEVGRGTSTFDGLAIAQAVVEYIYQTIQARCLFATHYHELTALCETMPGIKSFHAASTQRPEGIVLLHKIVPGNADGSFGLEVASRAHLPEQVIERARVILNHLKATETALHARISEPVFQGSKKSTPYEITPTEREKRAREQQLMKKLEQIDYDNLTPKQALDLLWSLKEGME